MTNGGGSVVTGEAPAVLGELNISSDAIVVNNFPHHIMFV